MINTILYIATSKDGFIADKDGKLDWLSYAENGAEDYGFTDFFNSIDFLVMGKKTYEQIMQSGEWPYEGIYTFVFSDVDLEDPNEEVIFFSGTPQELLDKLPIDSLVTRIWLVGGGELAAAFEKQGLIDEYIVTELPIELKDGTPLGIQLSDDTHQEVSTKKYDKDIIQRHYIHL